VGSGETSAVKAAVLIGGADAGHGNDDSGADEGKIDSLGKIFSTKGGGLGVQKENEKRIN
jgi:hypothetical protein